MRGTGLWLAVGTLGILGVVPAVRGNDWAQRARDDYHLQLRELDREYRAKLDELNRWEDRIDDRIEAQKRDALRNTHPREHGSLIRHYLAQKTAVDREHAERRKDVQVWYDQQKRLLESRYHAARDRQYYGTYRGPHHHDRGAVHGGPTCHVPPAPVRPHGSRVSWGFQVGPLALHFGG